MRTSCYIGYVIFQKDLDRLKKWDDTNLEVQKREIQNLVPGEEQLHAPAQAGGQLV